MPAPMPTDPVRTQSERKASPTARGPWRTAELVRGVLIVREPPGTGHGACSARLTLRVGAFVEQRELGEVFAQDTGFKIERDPDTVRAPDVAFVPRERLAQIPEAG